MNNQSKIDWLFHTVQDNLYPFFVSKKELRALRLFASTEILQFVIVAPVFANFNISSFVSRPLIVIVLLTFFQVVSE